MIAKAIPESKLEDLRNILYTNIAVPEVVKRKYVSLNNLYSKHVQAPQDQFASHADLRILGLATAKGTFSYYKLQRISINTRFPSIAKRIPFIT